MKETASQNPRTSGDWTLLRYLARRQWPLIALCALGLPLAGWFASRSFALNQPAAPAPEKPPATAPQSPLKLAEDARAKALQQAIDRAIEGGAFALARWGVCVLGRDGRVLAARNARELMSPASNFKVYTTAAALDLLGADYLWKTSVHAANAPDANGAINGDLTLYGRGAPDLATENLANLAAQLQQNGVRRIHGNIVGDETYFRADILGEGWLWNDVQWYFGAEVSALSVNGNAVALNAAPGQTSLTPATDYVHVVNTIKPGGAAALGINRGLSDNETRVWGETPGARACGRVWRCIVPRCGPRGFFARNCWCATLRLTEKRGPQTA